MKPLDTWMTVAALALGLAVPARAAVLDGDCRVRLEFLDNQQATFVVVTVIPPRAMEVDADVSIVVNGRLVKVEPILSLGPATIVAPAGPTGATLMACVDVSGVLRTSLDRMSPADAQACQGRNPEIAVTWPPDALERAPVGGLPTSGVAAARRPPVLGVRSR